MLLALELLISVFAVWRFTHMIYEEEGPFGIFARVQAWAARRPDKVGGINHAFECFYCLSMWASIPPAIYLAWSIHSFIGIWFAISGGAVFLHMKEDRLEQ